MKSIRCIDNGDGSDDSGDDEEEEEDDSGDGSDDDDDGVDKDESFRRYSTLCYSYIFHVQVMIESQHKGVYILYILRYC